MQCAPVAVRAQIPVFSKAKALARKLLQRAHRVRVTEAS